MGKPDRAYRQLWRVVDGAVSDAFHKHDDYLTRKGRVSARTSLVKRVTGTVLGFALQEAKRQRELAVTETALVTQDQASDVCASEAGVGASFVNPSDPHCRIGRIRFKRPSRYRARQAFDLRTTELFHAVTLEQKLVAAVERAVR